MGWPVSIGNIVMLGCPSGTGICYCIMWERPGGQAPRLERSTCIWVRVAERMDRASGSADCADMLTSRWTSGQAQEDTDDADAREDMDDAHGTHGTHGTGGTHGTHGTHGMHGMHGMHGTHRTHGMHRMHGTHGPIVELLPLSDSDDNDDWCKPYAEMGEDWFSEVGEDNDNDVPSPVDAVELAAQASDERTETPVVELYDSGSTRHISPYCDQFETLTPIPPKSFAAANKQHFDVMGIGSMIVQVPNGTDVSQL
ncbi:hypothetical protein DFH29DRAFT_882906 [Suillus ampliporus]|nr:hypothetical protein DFH29DRAFT_882906 [Suillus ampliporus]